MDQRRGEIRLPAALTLPANHARDLADMKESTARHSRLIVTALAAMSLFVVSAAGCQSAGRGSAVDGSERETHAAPADFDAQLDVALARFGESLTPASRARAKDLLDAAAVSAIETHGCDTCTAAAILERVVQLPASADRLTFRTAVRAALSDLTRKELYDDRS